MKVPGNPKTSGLEKRLPCFAQARPHDCRRVPAISCGFLMLPSVCAHLPILHTFTKRSVPRRARGWGRPRPKQNL